MFAANGRIPLSPLEEAAVDELLADHDGNAGLTRRDPGDSGPVVVEFDGRTCLVHDDGSVEEL